MDSINNTTPTTTIELHNCQFNKDQREKVKKVLKEVGCTSAKITEQTFTGSLTTGPLTFSQNVTQLTDSSDQNSNSRPVNANQHDVLASINSPQGKTLNTTLNMNAVSLDVNDNKTKQVIQKKNSKEKKDYKCEFPNCGKVISATVQQRNRTTQEHSLTHSTVRLIKCDEPGCTREYKTMKSKKEHYQAAHKNIHKTYGLLDFLKTNAKFEALYRQCFGTQIDIDKQKNYKTPEPTRK